MEELTKLRNVFICRYDLKRLMTVAVLLEASTTWLGPDAKLTKMASITKLINFISSNSTTRTIKP